MTEQSTPALEGQLIADLQAARALVAAGWCRNAFARNARHMEVSVHDPAAIRFCARGAIHCVADGDPQRLFPMAMAITAAVGEPEIVNWNDAFGRTQSEVLAAFDAAIAKATAS